MDSAEKCASAQFAKCEDAVGKRSRNTPSRAKFGRRQYEKWVVVVFRIGERCGRGKARGEKKSGEKSRLRYCEVQVDESTNTRCREPDVVLHFARKELKVHWAPIAQAKSLAAGLKIVRTLRLR